MTIEGRCLKCKKQREMKNLTLKSLNTKRGKRLMYRGVCPVCGTQMSKMAPAGATLPAGAAKTAGSELFGGDTQFESVNTFTGGRSRRKSRSRKSKEEDKPKRKSRSRKSRKSRSRKSRSRSRSKK